jgi:hypothetical protein
MVWKLPPKETVGAPDQMTVSQHSKSEGWHPSPLSPPTMVPFVMGCYVMGPLVLAPYEGALPLLVRWALRAGTKDFCPALAAQVKNIFFLTVNFSPAS